MLALQRAVDIFGTQKALAEAIGVTPGRVWQWMHQSDQPRNKISPDKAYLIEQATKGEVKREELRPDIFGPVDYGKTIEQGVA